MVSKLSSLTLYFKLHHFQGTVFTWLSHPEQWNLIQQTVAWAWLNGSIKRARFAYLVGWYRNMLAALFVLLQGPDISYSCLQTSRKLMASIFLYLHLEEGKNSTQAHRYCPKFGTSIHTFAEQTPGDQSALWIPTGTSTSTFTRKVPRSKRVGLSTQIVIKNAPFFKNSSSSGRGNKNLQQEAKGVKSFWGEGTKSRATTSQNLWAFWWWVSLYEDDGRWTSCPAPLIIQQAQKLIIHCLHNIEFSDPCSSPLSLNCEKTHGPFSYKCYLKFHGHLISNCWIIFVWRSTIMYIHFEFLLKASHWVSQPFFFLSFKKWQKFYTEI